MITKGYAASGGACPWETDVLVASVFETAVVVVSFW
jgi:hypothetical protein